MKIDKNKIIFVHIPRTGGSSIEHFLYKEYIEESFLRNYDFSQYVDFFPDLSNHFYKIDVLLNNYPKNKKSEWGKSHYIKSGLRENRFPQLLNKNYLVGWAQGRNSWLQHFTSKQIMNMVSKEQWKTYFKFAFVRNPWDRAVSEWSYLCRESRVSFKNHTLKDFLMERNFFKRLKFVDGPKNRHTHFKDQYSFIFDNNKLLVDFVGRFENFQEDFQKFCAINSIKLDKIPHINEGFRVRSNYLCKLQKPVKKITLPKDKRYRMYYTDETKQIVAERYALDIEKFQYEF